MCIIIYIGYVKPESLALYPLNRADYVMYLLWAWCFFLYMFNITYDDNKKMLNKYPLIIKITSVINLFIVLLIFSLKINLFNTRIIMYAYGPAVNCLYYICGAYVLLILLILLTNYRKLINKKYTPVYVFAFMAVLLLIVRKINPGLLLISLILSYIDLIMFFTMENPDLKMIKELSEAKEQVEKYGNDKASFLFNMTQRIRNPLTQIDEMANEISKLQDINDIKRIANDIVLSSQKVQYIVKDALDISAIDAKKINIVESQYNLNKVIDESFLRLKQAIKNKPISFNANISSDIPDMLYGDQIKMKQIFYTLLLNAADVTNSGFIECNVSCIRKHDVCRFIIKIEDSGRGLTSIELEHLYDNTLEENLESIDNSRVSLGVLKKMINLTGGTIMVQSEDNRGTEFIVVIDQKIVEEKEKSNKVLEQYEEMIESKKKVLIINNVEADLESFAKLFDSSKYEVLYAKTYSDAIKDIASADIIFVDEFLKDIKAEAVLQNIRAKTNRRIPVIINCESYNKEVLHKYINIGFTECILKPIKLQELNDILERQVSK